MSFISKILLPVAFSERCLGAARYAEALACHFQSELTLLHVLEPARYGMGFVESVPLPVQLPAASWFQDELKSFLPEAPCTIPMKRVVLEGDPARKIVSYAHSEKFDLILMPTHGYGPFRRFLLGSVTAKVLHDADCPVWTGPHMEEAPAFDTIRFHKIVCALDLGTRSSNVLAWGASMAREFGAELAIVHAIPASETRLAGVYFDPEWRTELARAARERVLYLQETLKLSAEVHIENGEVPVAVSEAAKRLAADLLIIGRAHNSGVMGRLHANAYAILRESPCPVASI